MGKIASDFADSIILTNDNPRFENPQKIRRDIKKGIKIKDQKWAKLRVILQIV